MVVTTEAVVLRSRKFSESSLIVTLLTRELGKVPVLVKGARRPRNPFGSSLQPMAYVTTVLYFREARELQLLTQCDIREVMPGLTGDLERMAAGMVTVELVEALTHPGEVSGVLFDHVLDTLRAISGATKNPAGALYFFEMRLLEILGFRPVLERCAVCGKGIGASEGAPAGQSSHLGQTGVLCAGCAAGRLGLVDLSPPSLKILQRLQELQEASLAVRIVMTERVRAEVGTALWRLFQSNVEGIPRIRSREVFASLEVAGLESRGT